MKMNLSKKIGVQIERRINSKNCHKKPFTKDFIKFHDDNFNNISHCSNNSAINGDKHILLNLEGK